MVKSFRKAVNYVKPIYLMKKSIFALVLICVATQFVDAQDKPILVTPQWLNQHKTDPGVVIVQVNYIKLDYEAEHIEGARYLWPGWLAPDSPEGSMNIPDAKTAAQIIQSLGISNNSHVVLCHVRNEVSVTSRMFLMLEYFGLKGKVSFLNGGLEAWKKEGYTITKEVAVVKPGKFEIKTSPLIVDRHYVNSNLESKTVDIIDARPKRYYDGDPTGNPRDGHIKGAKNLWYQDMVDESNAFKSDAEILSSFTAVTPDKNKEIITYCFIGQTASVVYLAGRLAGYNMKLYDGSMQEWSRIPELPMEKTGN